MSPLFFGLTSILQTFSNFSLAKSILVDYNLTGKINKGELSCQI
jgi:hypothetical protein